MATFTDTDYDSQGPWWFPDTSLPQVTSLPHSGHLSLTIPSNPSIHSSSLNHDGHDDSPLTYRQHTYGYLTPISPGGIQASPLTPPDISGGGMPFARFNYPQTSGYTSENAAGPVPGTLLEPQGGSFASGSTYQGMVPPIIPPTLTEKSHLPTITCYWGPCGQPIPLDQASLYKHLRDHMRAEQPPPGPERSCRWYGCVCAARTTTNGRCKGQPAGQHPTHVQSIEQHVWDVHLGLRWACNRCHQADFTTERSMKRHQKHGCAGQVTANTSLLYCASCKSPMQSQADMNAHAQTCLTLERA